MGFKCQAVKTLSQDRTGLLYTLCLTFDTLEYFDRNRNIDNKVIHIFSYYLFGRVIIGADPRLLQCFL